MIVSGWSSLIEALNKGSWMNIDVDTYVGKRLRRRRRLMGLTQATLAAQIGVRFQQVQKYECGANRVTSERLFRLSKALGVSVNYFFEGYELDPAKEPAPKATVHMDGDILYKDETTQLVRAYYRLDKRKQQRFLALLESMAEEEKASGSMGTDRKNPANAANEQSSSIAA